MNGSRATSLASSLAGGAGGAPNGRAGAAWTVDGSSTLGADARARPTTAEINGSQERGQTVQLVALGAPASAAVLLLSYRGDLVPLHPLAAGSLLASPALTLGPISLSSSGDLRAGFTIPATWPLGETYFAQFLSLQPGPNLLWASNAVSLHVNH